MIVLVDYASPSVFESNRESASLGLANQCSPASPFSGCGAKQWL